ncbi:MAG: TIGR04076 family protein [Anaerolineaceae bacterium]|nr:TIGR04076 family protein [Anaerolineaceae bacterium]
MKMPKVKITVIKRTIFPDVIEEYYPSEMVPCEVFYDGQDFIIERDTVAPEGFCAWAYADIQKYIMLLRHDGKPMLKHENTSIACCTDGFRPVVFKLERIEED